MKIAPKHTASDLTIFSEMTALATKHKAINLAQGFPDYEIDEVLKKLLGKATEQNYNQYAPLAGNPLLINNLIEFNKKRTATIDFDSSEITIIPGATYGIFTALSTILQPDDEVIILEPAYDCYQPAIEINSGIPVFVALDENFEVDWELLNSKISEKTKAIIVNSPHNPSGKIWTSEDWEKLWQLIKSTKIMVISDEVYDLLCYDDLQFYSVFQHPEIKKRCFCIFSFGKMFHITGWKIGYIIANPELTQAFRRIHQYLTFCVNAPAQQALAEYLEIFDTQKNNILMQQKRDFFLSEISKTSFSLKNICQGSYFQILGYENISDKNEKEFAYWLTENHKVASIPVSAFYHDKKEQQLLRFCFAKKEETILEAIKNLKLL